MSPLADIVLLVMAVELALLVAGGRRPLAVVAALLPGALLVVALRIALVGGDWPWIAAVLFLALPLHFIDLRARGWLGGDSVEAQLRRLRPSGKYRSTPARTGAESGPGWRGL